MMNKVTEWWKTTDKYTAAFAAAMAACVAFTLWLGGLWLAGILFDAGGALIYVLCTVIGGFVFAYSLDRRKTLDRYR